MNPYTFPAYGCRVVRRLVALRTLLENPDTRRRPDVGGDFARRGAALRLFRVFNTSIWIRGIMKN